MEPGQDQEGGRTRACRALWDMLRRSNTGNFREKDKTSESMHRKLVIRNGSQKDHSVRNEPRVNQCCDLTAARKMVTGNRDSVANSAIDPLPCEETHLGFATVTPVASCIQ